MVKNLPVKFILFASLLLVAIFTVENINHRFWLNDFRVYYGAAQALLDGKPVYDTLFALGSGYYKYSPFTLLLVVPFCFFPYTIACYIHYFFLSVAIISVFIFSWHIINKYLFDGKIKKPDVLLSVAFVCVINHLVRELHLGNINVVLLLLLCVSLFLILEERPIAAGIFLAIVIITKPFFALLFLPLLMRKKIKVILASGASLVTFFLIPAIFIGLQGNILLHKEWLHTLLGHNSAFPSNNTIENLLKLYIYPGIPPAVQFYIMIAACLGYLALFYFNRTFERKNSNDQRLQNPDLAVEWFALIAIMPGLFKTDTQHFLLSLPLLMILLFYLSASRNYSLIVCFIVLILMYGGNSSDMIGKSLSARMDESGILGISNLIILIWILIVYPKVIRRKQEGSSFPEDAVYPATKSC